MSAVFDIVTVVIIAVIVLSSMSKGFVRSLIELCGYVASFVVAGILSVPAGAWIYEHLIKTALYNGAASYIGSLTGSARQSFSQFLAAYHLNADLVDAAVKSGDAAAGSAIMTGFVAPVGGAIGRGIAFIVIFFVCLALVGALAHVGNIFNRLPVIGGINRLGGALIGVVKAMLAMFLICTVISILIPIFSVQKDPPFTNTTVSGTTVFQYFYNANPVKDILLKN